MKPIKTLILTLGLGVALAGCDDAFLVTPPPDELSEATFWKTAKDAELAVNAIYPFLWDSEIIYLDGVTDNAIAQKTFSAQYPYLIGTHQATSGWSRDLWAAAYRAIGRANVLLANIDNIPNMDPQLRDRVKGEATFHRAYHYTNLVNLFGDVPLLLEPTGNTVSTLEEARTVTRTPASQVVDQILADLDYAASVLPVSYSGADRGRVTRGAALALKARAALLAGRWADAAAAAKAVMDLGIYSLYPNYRDLFTYAGEGSAEVILDKQYIKDQYAHGSFATFGPRSEQGGSDVVPTRSLVDEYEVTDGLSIEDSPLYDADNPYANRDPRLDGTMLRPGSVFNGKVYDSTPESTTADRLANDFNATQTGYNLLKYVDEADADDRSNSGINYILIRYAEVLLTYAEAKIELGDLDGTEVDAINMVRQRVGMPELPSGLTQAELRDRVRHERRVELAMEGLRLFDIRRWRIAETVMPGDTYGIDVMVNGVRQPYKVAVAVRRFDPARDYLWPIPQEEINLNPNLTQNPGY